MNGLHLGAGDHPLGGIWLDTDVAYPQGMGFLDATKRFPFSDGRFDYVFTEHMIEHLPLEGGINLLKESFRVLKPGGRIRVSTPSLTQLFELLSDPYLQKHEDYIAWACKNFCPSSPVCAETVINNFVRAWGHQFIYSWTFLANLLLNSGFSNIVDFPVGESHDENLRNLENVSRMPPGFLQLETMTIEGVKPSA